jgi:hypothetical protein
MAAVHIPPAAKPSSTFAAWSQNGPLDKRVCILPFTNHTQSEGLADRVRESFFGRLALKRFTDVELRELDARLTALPQPWSKLPSHQLGQALQCDALVYGEVLDASNIYLGVYAQLTLEGKIQLVDAASNQTLVTGSHATKFRTGGVPFSLLAVVPSAVINLRNLSSEQALRAVDDLARNLADKIPDLPGASDKRTVVAVNALAEQTPAKRVLQEQSMTSEPAPLMQEPYRVQVGAFSKPGEARHAAQLLRKEGFQPMIVIATQGEREWHKVLLGPFPSRDAAQETGARVQQRLPFSPVIIHSAAR